MAYTTKNLETSGSWVPDALCGIVELATDKLIAAGRNGNTVRCWASTDGGTSWVTLFSATKGHGEPALSPPMDGGDTCYLFLDGGASSFGTYRKITWSGSAFATSAGSLNTGFGKVGRVLAQAVVANQRVSGLRLTSTGITGLFSMHMVTHALSDDFASGVSGEFGNRTVYSNVTVAQGMRQMLPYAWRHNGDGLTPVNASADGRVFFVDSNGLGNPIWAVYLDGLIGIRRAALHRLGDSTVWTSASGQPLRLHIFGDGSKLWAVAPAGSSSTKMALLGLPYSLLTSGKTHHAIGGFNEYTKINAVAYRDGHAYIMAEKSGSRDILEVNLATGAMTKLETGIPDAYDRAVMFPRSGRLVFFRSRTNSVKVLIRNLASAPQAPTLLSPDPSATTTVNRAGRLLIDWVFTSTDGTAQAKAELRRRVGSTTRYWNGSSWVASSSAATRRNLTASEISLTAARWLDSSRSSTDHEFSVRVAASGDDTLLSPWSRWSRVAPRAARTLTVRSLGGVTYRGATREITIDAEFPVLVWSISGNAPTTHSYRITEYRYINDNASNAALRSGNIVFDDVDHDPDDGSYRHTEQIDVSDDGFRGYFDLTATADGIDTNTVRVRFFVDYPDAPAPFVSLSAVDDEGNSSAASDSAGVEIALEWDIPRSSGAPRGQEYDYINRVTIDRRNTSTDAVERMGRYPLSAPPFPPRGTLTQRHSEVDWALAHDTDYEYVVYSTSVSGRTSEGSAS